MRLELREVRELAQSGEGNGSCRFIESLVSAAFGLKPAALRGSRRGTERVALARQIGMYLAHTRLGLNYTASGALFGRDRTTAAHAVRKIEEQREDLILDSMLDCLERSVDVWPRSLGGAADIQ
jgi:chromosomal replication initiation ATPase DnaA